LILKKHCEKKAYAQSEQHMQPGGKDDILHGFHLHRLDVDWKWVARDLKNAIGPQKLLDDYGIFHPRSTCAKIAPEKARKLILDMQTYPSFSRI
jgi:hypothetical protein